MQGPGLRPILLIPAVLIALLAGVFLGTIAPELGFDRSRSVAVTRAIEPRGELAAVERTTIEIFERVAPSVVQVLGRRRGNLSFSEDDGSGLATGTGFIWDGAGHVVTNDHVVNAAAAIAVRLATGEVVEANVVGLAPNYDLAVIRIRRAKQLPPAVALGTSADLKVGQAAFAIGNPFGLDQSLTTGIISALKRRLPTNGGREISNVIQTDAAINPGNSGGPLLDSAGRLIGVNTAILSPSGSNAGIGFAIPVDIVNRVVPELIRNGRVPIPGIGIAAVGEAAATRLGIEGVVIMRTAPGSPAERAGLRGVDPSNGSIGDVIVQANGKPVHRLVDLTDELERIGVGTTIRLTVKRGSQTRELDIAVVDVGRPS
jgi:2-alkenal reductase